MNWQAATMDSLISDYSQQKGYQKKTTKLVYWAAARDGKGERKFDHFANSRTRELTLYRAENRLSKQLQNVTLY